MSVQEIIDYLLANTNDVEIPTNVKTVVGVRASGKGLISFHFITDEK